MKRILLGAVLALLLPSLGCVGYHNGYSSPSSSSPGCYSCGHTRHDHEGRGSGHRDGHGGGRRHRDHDDDHHHRHH